MKTICHIITGLNDGGAEAVLYRLCERDQNLRHVVISLTGEGKYGPLLRKAGIEVHCLDLPAGRLRIKALWHLWRLLRKMKPTIVQTWMYHADFVGGLVSRLAGVKQVFWGIRHTNLEIGKTKRSTRLIACLNAMLSKCIPHQIICCAIEAKQVHQNLGYDSKKLVVIPNGYDLKLFNETNQAQLKIDFDLSETTMTIGMVGRFDPQKDHRNLIEALALLKTKIDNFACFLIGRGLDQNNTSLIKKIESLELPKHILLLGQRNDIPKVMNSLDVHVLSSSFGEAFPNVLAEAMACGTPCVTTDVGDARLIVGETGWVVPPSQPKALADAILSAFYEKTTQPQKWRERKILARQRIVDNFGLETMIEKYHKCWLIDANP